MGQLHGSRDELPPQCNLLHWPEGTPRRKRARGTLQIRISWQQLRAWAGEEGPKRSVDGHRQKPAWSKKTKQQGLPRNNSELEEGERRPSTAVSSNTREAPVHRTNKCNPKTTSGEKDAPQASNVEQVTSPTSNGGQ